MKIYIPLRSKSSPSAAVLPKKFSQVVESESSLTNPEMLGYLVTEGGGITRTEMNTGGLLPEGGSPPNSRESTQVNTEARDNSIQECALAATLKAVRGLRDEFFIDDANLRSGLLLAQTTLIFERIERGIPSGRDAFDAILRAARLPESVPEAAEPTTEMAESPV